MEESKGVQSETEVITKIEDALDRLLTAIVQHDRAMESAAPSESWAWVAWTGEQAHAPEDDLDLGSLLQDPVGGALELGVAELGRHLFRLLGSTEAMKGVLERVAERDSAHWVVRTDILSRCWEGIGQGSDVWMV